MTYRSAIDSHRAFSAITRNSAPGDRLYLLRTVTARAIPTLPIPGPPRATKAVHGARRAKESGSLCPCGATTLVADVPRLRPRAVITSAVTVYGRNVANDPASSSAVEIVIPTGIKPIRTGNGSRPLVSSDCRTKKSNRSRLACRPFYCPLNGVGLSAPNTHHTGITPTPPNVPLAALIPREDYLTAGRFGNSCT